MPLDITHDDAHQRFTTTVDGRTAFLSYRMAGAGQIDLRSTYVPPAIRERGIGRQLVEHVLAYAEVRELEVIPTCWFVRQVLREGGTRR